MVQIVKENLELQMEVIEAISSQMGQSTDSGFLSASMAVITGVLARFHNAAAHQLGQ